MIGPLSLKDTIEQFNNFAAHQVFDGVFITTNETCNRSLKWLKRASNSANLRCHIGVSCLHNFRIMAHRRSDFGIIIDFNENNKLFIDKVLEIVRDSADRKECSKKIRASILKEWKENKNFFGKVCIIKERYKIQKLTQNLSSWLGNDIAFAHIQKMAQEERIVAITENILDSDKFKTIKDIMLRQGFFIDTLYLSNIAAFFCPFREDLHEQYLDTVFNLIEDETLMIFCPTFVLKKNVALGLAEVSRHSQVVFSGMLINQWAKKLSFPFVVEQREVPTLGEKRKSLTKEASSQPLEQRPAKQVRGSYESSFEVTSEEEMQMALGS